MYVYMHIYVIRINGCRWLVSYIDSCRCRFIK